MKKEFKKGQKVLVRASKDYPWVLGYYHHYDDNYKDSFLVYLSYKGFILAGLYKVNESNIIPYNSTTKKYEGIVGGPEYEDED